MKFTGERYIPTEQGKIRLEHYHRYAVVLDFVRKKAVLDIACGEGYGSFLMADEAHSVIGVDISEEAVRHASKTYDKKNLRFVQGSATKLTFQDNLFDAIISFETIEHLSEQKQMLSEFRRVLRPDGVLIISSPNRPVYSEESGEHNEFHVKELNFNEFDALLRSQFPKVEYFGQRMQMSSVIQPVNGAPSISSVWSDDGRTLRAKVGRLSEPVYFLALCGSEGADLPKIGMSALYPESTDLVKHYVGFAKWAKSLDKIISERDAQILNLDKIISERDAQILAFLKSKSWRITRPLREIRRWLSALKEQAVRALKAVVAALKRNHHHLPISYKVKVDIYRILCQRFPGISGLYAAKPTIINLNHLSKFIIDGPLNSQSLEKMLDAVLPIRVDEAPLVSVIIPVYGKINFTLSCLSSISENLPLAAFEVIVVDDCSPDDSIDILSKVKGIRVQRNENNQGFIPSCNIGAKAAKGQYLYFLNNDTVVTTGWLDELLRTFLEFPGTGLVGSKLVYPDGRLQEAGGIVWNDASCWNYGKGEDKDHINFNYARDVDYCSGASIMIPKNLFFELGMFDNYFAPAYYEDTDLAFKVREKGLRVIYQPLSEVFHFEGTTSGTNINSGVKQNQKINKEKFFTRYQDLLAHHYKNGEHVDKAIDKTRIKNCLVIDTITPMPDKDSGSIDTYNQLMFLNNYGFHTTFIPLNNFAKNGYYTQKLQKKGIKCIYYPYYQSLKKFCSDHKNFFDLVLINRQENFRTIYPLAKKYFPNAKLWLHNVDLNFIRLARQAKIEKNFKLIKQAKDIKNSEITNNINSDISSVVSLFELNYLQNKDINCKLLPLFRNKNQKKIKTFDERNGLMFIAGFNHRPNQDSLTYFLDDIFPSVQKYLPGVQFSIIGNNLPENLVLRIKEFQNIHYYADRSNNELEELANNHKIGIAPLRYGAGTKGKIITYMANNLPFVASNIALEGINLYSIKDCIYHSNTDFVEKLVNLYQNKLLYEHVQKEISFLYNKNYSEIIYNDKFEKILKQLGFKNNYHKSKQEYDLKIIDEASKSYCP